MPNISKKWFSLQTLLAIMLSIVSNYGTKGSEMFSLNKLIEYNTLIDCFTTIKDDFSACNRNAQKRGEFVLRFVDESSSLGTLLKCCGTWIVRDCWVAASKDKCAQGATQQLHNLPAKFMPAITDMCNDYQPGSFYCFIPHMIGIGAVILAVILLGASIAISVIVYRRHIRLKRVEVESEHSNNNEEKLNEV